MLGKATECNQRLDPHINQCIISQKPFSQKGAFILILSSQKPLSQNQELEATKGREKEAMN